MHTVTPFQKRPSGKRRFEGVGAGYESLRYRLWIGLTAAALLSLPAWAADELALDGTQPRLSNVSAAEPADRIETVRPSALAHLLDELAGRTLRVRNARVVGVLDPRTFLIESSTPSPMMLGTRDRIVVFVEGGALRVEPAALVTSSVVVVGVLRTLLGLQVTGEVSWPQALSPEAVQRLEVRAAVLATSVQTADGVELTDRARPPAR
jgi:hypothetical protein